VVGGEGEGARPEFGALAGVMAGAPAERWLAGGWGVSWAPPWRESRGRRGEERMKGKRKEKKRKRKGERECDGDGDVMGS